MGILGLFSSARLDYPSLDSSILAAKQLESVLSPSEKLAEKTNDPLEIVPTEDSAYIFFGKSPKKFGVLWIEDGDKIVNFRSLANERKEVLKCQPT